MFSQIIDDARRKGQGMPANVMAQQINPNLFQGAMGGQQQGGGGGGGQQQAPFAAGPQQMGNRYYQPPQSYFPQNSVPSALNNFLVQGYMNAPQQLVGDINSAFDQFQYYADRAGNRNTVRDVLSQMLSGFGNQSNNATSQLAGFKDVNSVNEVNIPVGEVTSGVTMQPLAQGQIDAGINTIASAQAPGVGAQYGAGDTGGIADHLANLTRNAASRNAMNAERDVASENAGLARATEVARVDDELEKMRWAMGRRWSDAQNQVAQNNRQLSNTMPLVQMLMGMV